MQKAQGPGVCKLPKPPASRALCQAKRAPRAALPSGCLAAQTKRWAEGIRVPQATAPDPISTVFWASAPPCLPLLSSLEPAPRPRVASGLCALSCGLTLLHRSQMPPPALSCPHPLPLHPPPLLWVPALPPPFCCSLDKCLFLVITLLATC